MPAPVGAGQCGCLIFAELFVPGRIRSSFGHLTLSRKRTTNWTGYAVHLTETCDPAGPKVITHVATTPATTADVALIETIHEDLAQQDLLPSEHLVDAGYIAADQMLHSQQDHQVDLLGPTAGEGTHSHLTVRCASACNLT